MDFWPASLPSPSAAPMGVRDPLVEDDYMSGDDAARPAMSRPRMAAVTLEWSAMHRDNVQVLRDFRAEHRAALFLWTDPWTGEIYEARFQGDSPLTWTPRVDLPHYAKVTATVLPVRVWGE